MNGLRVHGTWDCPSCNGTRGWADAEAMDWVDCPDCAGTGKAENSITANEAEPLHLTLEDLLLRFSDINASLRVYRGPDGGAGWFGVRNSNGVSFGPFDSWAETAPSILGVPVVARDDTAELVEALEAYFAASDNYMPEQDRFYQEAKSNLRAALARVKGEQP